MSLSAKTGQGLKPHQGHNLSLARWTATLQNHHHPQDRDAVLVSVDTSVVLCFAQPAQHAAVTLYWTLQRLSTSGQDTTIALPGLHIKAWSLCCSQYTQSIHTGHQ